MRIIRNAVKCNTCGDIIESNREHDFVECSCGQVFVDGATEYIRRGFTDSPKDFTELSEFDESER